MSVCTAPAEIAASIRRDIAWSAQTGAPPLGHLAGLHRRHKGPAAADAPYDDLGPGYALALDPSRPYMTGGAGILEFAMLADLALGGAIRNQVGLELPMPTICMTIQLAPGRVRDVEWADAECTTRLERTASARAQLHTTDGEIVGDAVGLFALPKIPYDGPGRAMPWDLPHIGTGSRAPKVSDASEASADAGVRDAMLVRRVAAHAAAGPEHAWGTAHVAEQLAFTDEFALHPTEAMANRLGHVQGGALLTTAVLAAARIGAFELDALATATIEFISAADLRAPLVPDVDVTRASGRSLFASVVLRQGGQVRSHVTTVFRR